MSDDRSDLEEAVRLLRLWARWHYAPYIEAETRDFLARHPEKPKLLPCPFCWGEAEWHGGTEAGSVRCRVCEAAGPHKDTARAIATWNRRAKPASGPLSGGKPE